MKLKHVMIKNFKGVRALEFPTDAAPHALRSLTALLGDNGSGKTSVLQAIALTLSMATRRTRVMGSFSWHGFLPERVPSLGPTFVELLVAFEPEEVTLTNDLFVAWQESLSSDRRQTMKIVPPSRHTEVILRFEQGRVSSPQGFEALNQFLGRYYVKALKDTRPELKDSFAKLGDIFWFDQHRNLGSLMAEDLASEARFREEWRAGDMAGEGRMARRLALRGRATSRVPRRLVGFPHHSGTSWERFHSTAASFPRKSVPRHSIRWDYAPRRGHLSPGERLLLPDRSR